MATILSVKSFVSVTSIFSEASVVSEASISSTVHSLGPVLLGVLPQPGPVLLVVVVVVGVQLLLAAVPLQVGQEAVAVEVGVHGVPVLGPGLAPRHRVHRVHGLAAPLHLDPVVTPAGLVPGEPAGGPPHRVGEAEVEVSLHAAVSGVAPYPGTMSHWAACAGSRQMFCPRLAQLPLATGAPGPHHWPPPRLPTA